MTWEPAGPPTVLTGHGALQRLAAFREHAGCRSVALVVDAALAGPGGYPTVVEEAVAGPPVAVVAIPPGEPSVASVDGVAAALAGLDRPLVVGVGGGSALDTAKQVAVLLHGPLGSIGPYVLARLPLPGRRPLVAVPTTAGTGAEVTRTCVLSDEAGRKVWTWGDALLPDLIVLDPAATVTMPTSVTTGTGLDAFVHAVEAVTGQRRHDHPPADAQRAVALVARHLPAAVVDGQDRAARAGMQEAAFLAGRAIDACGTGAAHAVGHALGSLYHLPHGISVAIGLEAALHWTVESEPAAFAPVAAALGVPTTEVPSRYRALWRAARLADAARGGAGRPPVTLDPATIAAAMVAEENLPMLLNSCRVPSDAERLAIAHHTADVWAELQGDSRRPRGRRPPRPGGRHSVALGSENRSPSDQTSDSSNRRPTSTTTPPPLPPAVSENRSSSDQTSDTSGSGGDRGAIGAGAS